jgi:rubrerythrin
MQVWGGVTLVDQDGEPCTRAFDPTCITEVRNLQAMQVPLITTTEGDLVGGYRTPEEATAFLGRIDTPDEALLVATLAGYQPVCNDPTRTSVREVRGGYEVVVTRSEMSDACDALVYRDTLLVSRDGSIRVLNSEYLESIPVCAIGRRPEGLLAGAAPEGRDKTANFFASIAHLESAAVDAFLILARELEALGAPSELVEAARRSADEEVRHTELMGAVARGLGANPVPAEVEDRPLRDLKAIALENAIEGCVRETYGALVGTFQSMATPDAEIAAALREISEDETRHAETSWQIASWVESQLSEEERAEIEAARQQAIIDLRAEVAIEPDPQVRALAGLPSAAQAVAMVDQLSETIWA